MSPPVGRALERSIRQELPELGPLARIRAGGNESSMTALQMRREIAEIRKMDPDLVTRTYDMGSRVASRTGRSAVGVTAGHHFMSESGATVDEVRRRRGDNPLLDYVPQTDGWAAYRDVKSAIDREFEGR